MNLTIKNYLKGTLIIIICLFISSILVNTFYYFDIISNNSINYLKMILSIFIFFIGGLYIGKKSTTKGYINGLKLSLIIVILYIIMGLIFNNIKISRIIFYIIICTCITFGAMIGINKKNK